MPSFSTFLQKAVFLYFCHSLEEYIAGFTPFPESYSNMING